MGSSKSDKQTPMSSVVPAFPESSALPPAHHPDWWPFGLLGSPGSARVAGLWNHTGGRCTQEMSFQVCFNEYLFAVPFVPFWRLNILGFWDFPINSDLFTHGRALVGITNSFSDRLAFSFHVFTFSASLFAEGLIYRINAPFTEDSLYLCFTEWVLTPTTPNKSHL